MPGEPLPLTLRGRRVVRQLRELRGELGLSLEAAAERSGLSAATISRIENRETKPLLKNVRALLQAYGAGAELTARMVTWTRSVDERGWWVQLGGSLLEAPFQDLLALEQDATLKRSFEALSIPGLLQTENYARALLSAVGHDLSNEEFDQMIKLRMERQERVGHLHLQVLLLEETLLRTVGGAKTMRAQLDHLLTASKGAHHAASLTLRILPLSQGAHVGMFGSFSILSFPEPDEDVVYVEGASGQACIEGEERVAPFNTAFESLSAQALSVDASLELIATAIGSSASD